MQQTGYYVRMPETHFEAMSLLVSIFKDRHLQVSSSRRNFKVDSQTLFRNYCATVNYLDGRKKKRKYEGYWINNYNDCIVGLRRTGHHKYTAYVIRHRNGILVRGEPMAQFEHVKRNRYRVDYHSTFTGLRYFLFARFQRGSQFVIIPEGNWRKIDRSLTDDFSHFPEYNSKVRGGLYGPNSYVLTIPSCSRSYVPVVDSLLVAEYQKIASCKNLIIDIRNNFGGTSRIYESLLPLIYTKPIQITRVYLYGTEDHIMKRRSELEQYLKDGGNDSGFIKDSQYFLALERANIGRFFLYDPDSIKFDSTLERPKNIGLIINFGCQSAAELMVLAFRQSNKVTVFGESTCGAIDYLDYYYLELPSKRYRLYMPTTKRYIPKGEHELDQTGIKPDIFIKPSVHNWVQFVADYYERQN